MLSSSKDETETKDKQPHSFGYRAGAGRILQEYGSLLPKPGGQSSFAPGEVASHICFGQHTRAPLRARIRTQRSLRDEIIAQSQRASLILLNDPVCPQGYSVNLKYRFAG